VLRSRKEDFGPFFELVHKQKKIALRLCTPFEEEGSVKNEKRSRTPKVRSLAAEEDTLCGEPAQP